MNLGEKVLLFSFLYSGIEWGKVCERMSSEESKKYFLAGNCSDAKVSKNCFMVLDPNVFKI